MEKRIKVAVALSGGVDSAVSALLLKEKKITFSYKNYDLIGITFHLFQGQEAQIEKAKGIAKFLGIDHVVFDLRKVFKEKVIKYFIELYKKGLTPNPCAICNRLIKFGLVTELMEKELAASYLATGHYVEIAEYKGYKLLKVSRNVAKDQSYFLALIDQEKLGKLIFPVGTFFSKDEVRKYALEKGLVSFEKKESQEVCFFQGKSLKDFLMDYLPLVEGEIIYRDKVVGRHKGYFFYTIGQRRGLNLPMGKPLYVIKTDPARNRVFLGEKKDLLKGYLYLDRINFHLPLDKWNKVSAQIRYRSEKVPVKDLIKDERGWKVIFEREVAGIAPGQICAFYEEEYLLGGGIILRET